MTAYSGGGASSRASAARSSSPGCQRAAAASVRTGRGWSRRRSPTRSRDARSARRSLRPPARSAARRCSARAPRSSRIARRWRSARDRSAARPEAQSPRRYLPGAVAAARPRTLQDVVAAEFDNRDLGPESPSGRVGSSPWPSTYQRAQPGRRRHRCGSRRGRLCCCSAARCRVSFAPSSRARSRSSLSPTS